MKTDIVAEKFDICTELAIGEHRKLTIEKPAEETGSIEHIMNLSDIDFNGHVNNKSYLTVAEATMPDSFRREYMLSKIKINFKRETFLGDAVLCSTSSTAIEDIYTHHLTKDDVAVCEIETTWNKRGNEESILDWSIRDSNP